jgi:FkbM family methyltransferase
MPATQSSHWAYTIDEWTREPFTRLISKLPTELSVVYDVGANVGGWTEVIHMKYPDAQFFTFEPVKENYNALKENVPYATNLPYGIFYGARSSKVRWRGGNVGAYFVQHIDHGPDFIEEQGVMELRTFEELQLPEPTLIKFDVEGSEENIIEHSSLVKKTPWLIVEWHPNSDPFQFFKEHLPNHEIIDHLERNQFLLCLK